MTHAEVSFHSKAKACASLMVQGTASDAGKTTLVAGLCRLFARKYPHTLIAPFKPQNMALNSAVTIDGGEIGRAQALQAAACFQLPIIDFNPVLLKPTSNQASQVIIQGKALSTLEAKEFWGEKGQNYKAKALHAVLDSFQRLEQNYSILFIEGAGSPAEINLRQGDIANMGFAEEVDCPVILIADIDKGGVFAQLVGTLALLSASEQKRVKGFVINRFRGDISLLKPGLNWLEEYTGKPVIGVLPYLEGLSLDSEDSLVENQQQKNEPSSNGINQLKVQVLVYPRISNHTDFDALRFHPNVDFNYVDVQKDINNIKAADLIILPGSKNVRQDLAILLEHGFENHLKRHLRYGGKIIGICGGYQMLGLEIDDSRGFDGESGVSDGLGLLPLVTEFKSKKQLYNVDGFLKIDEQKEAIKGYEIHCGDSHKLRPLASPFSWQRIHSIEDKKLTYLDDHKKQKRSESNMIEDGLLSEDGQIMGTYLHGLFDSPKACDLLLSWAGLAQSQNSVDIHAQREVQLNRLADVIEANLDIELLERIIGEQRNDQQQQAV